MLELARVFARRPTEATIVLAAVAGEEQGLFGSTFLAQQLKSAGTDVQAMFSNDIVGASEAFDGTRPDPRTVRPGTPKAVVIVATSLTNQSTLHWTRGAEPDLAGYEVLWRGTTAPDWTNVIPVGDVTSVTVDLVKDNVHIGLRAVDRDGHRSPVAYPRPGA